MDGKIPIENILMEIMTVSAKDGAENQQVV
jgi:hypothetical protein